MIQRATLEDLPQILSIQHHAYRAQAILNNDFAIPPLTETLLDLEQVFTSVVFLKAVTDDGAIIGSLRGRPDGDTCHVGRVFVHPDLQGKGIGTQLLTAIESFCPKPRYELFTSNKSVDNIRLYERMGYVSFKEIDAPAGYKLVYMEKFLPANI